MRRNTLNFLVDAATLLAIFAMVATGLVICFVLPPGTSGRHGEGGLLLWGLGRHNWGDVHFWASVARGVLLVALMALHWSWVCTMVHRSLGSTDAGQLGAGRRNAYGIGFLLATILVFGGFTWYAGTAVTLVNARRQSESRPVRAQDNTPQHGQEKGHGAAPELIRGSICSRIHAPHRSGQPRYVSRRKHLLQSGGPPGYRRHCYARMPSTWKEFVHVLCTSPSGFALF